MIHKHNNKLCNDTYYKSINSKYRHLRLATIIFNLHFYLNISAGCVTSYYLVSTQIFIL